MKNVFIAATAALGFTATAAAAESLLPVPVMGQMEYATEAETFTLDLGTELTMGPIALTPIAEMSDAGGEFDFTGADLTASYMIGDSVDLFVTVEGDDEFAHEETSFGVAFKF